MSARKLIDVSSKPPRVVIHKEVIGKDILKNKSTLGRYLHDLAYAVAQVVKAKSDSRGYEYNVHIDEYMTDRISWTVIAKNKSANKIEGTLKRRGTRTPFEYGTEALRRTSVR